MGPSFLGTPFLGFFEPSASLGFESRRRRQSFRTDSRLSVFRSHRGDMGTLPNAYFTTSFIENSFVVFQSHFPGSLCIERIPQRLVLIEDRYVLGLIGRCYCIGAKQKAVRVLLNKSGDSRCRFWTADKIFGDFVPSEIKVNVIKVGILQDLFDLCGVVLAWPDGASQAHVGPNDGRIAMPFKESLYLTEVSRFAPLLCKRDVDIVVDQPQPGQLPRQSRVTDREPDS